MRAWAAYTKQHLPQWVFCLLMRITKNNFPPTLRTIWRMLTEDKFPVFFYLIGFQVLFSYSWSTSRWFWQYSIYCNSTSTEELQGMKNLNLWSIETAQDGVYTSLYWIFRCLFLWSAFFGIQVQRIPSICPISRCSRRYFYIPPSFLFGATEWWLYIWILPVATQEGLVNICICDVFLFSFICFTWYWPVSSF